MSSPLSSLSSTEGLKAFLSSYHAILRNELGFPALGLQKALHIAAKAIGAKNWNTLAAEGHGEETATQLPSLSPDVVAIMTGKHSDPTSSTTNCPFTEAITWITEHPYTGGSHSLSKLVLSLYNDECGFSFRECIGNLDEHLSSLAVRMVQAFEREGETAALRKAGETVNRLYPHYWPLCEAMQNARSEYERQRRNNSD